MKESLRLIDSRVAISAFHDSVQDTYVPRCHPHTRQGVLQKIMKWVSGDSMVNNEPLIWLHGAAGAGKSAICQSVLDLCNEKGVLAASFFLFRADPTRNTTYSLVPTLVYQLIQPSTSNLISQDNFSACMDSHLAQTLMDNPLVLEQSLETQLRLLILNPINRIRIQESSKTQKILIVIDGLDECTGTNNEAIQTNLILTFARLLAKEDVPVRVLISSRPEYHLVSAVEKANHSARTAYGKSTRNVIHSLSLDSGGSHFPEAAEDIQLYVNETLASIMATHPLRHLLPTDGSWPPSSLVRSIVAQSSGQFIYAAVALKFIEDPRADPRAQARVIYRLAEGLHQDTMWSKSRANAYAPAALAPLDALYAHILSQVPSSDIGYVHRILACSILGGITSLESITPLVDAEDMCGLGDIGSAEAALGSIRAVVAVEPNRDNPLSEKRHIRFLHASFPTFLLSKSRSGAYHIDKGPLAAQFAARVLEQSKYMMLSGTKERTLLSFLEHAKAQGESPSTLHDSIISYRPPEIVRSMYDTFLTDYLTAVKELDLGDGGRAYAEQLELITRSVQTLCPSLVYLLREMHDVDPIIQKMRQEIRMLHYT